MDNRKSDFIAALNLVRRISALVGIVLIAAGEFMMVAAPVVDHKTPTGLWISILGILILLAALFLKTSPAAEAKLSQFKMTRKAFGLLLSLLLCGLTIFAFVLFRKYGNQNFIPVILTWLASGLMYLLAFGDMRLSGLDLRAWLKKYRIELILLGLAVVIGAVLRFYQLGDVPGVIDGDEGLIGLNAQLTADGDLSSPFSLWENFGSLYLQLVNWMFGLFGASAFSLRILPAISGTLAIPALYLLARQIAGPRIAVIAAFLLSASHAHIHFSHIGSVGYIHDTWIIPLELYFLLRGLEKRNSFLMAAGGLLLAFHYRLYLTSQFVTGLVALYMLFLFLWHRPRFKAAWKQMLTFWGGFLVMMAPQMRYIIRNPNEMVNRLMQDGTFQSGWLQQRMADTGQSAFQILADRVLHSFLSLIYYPAIDFYGAYFPLLSVFSAIFFLIGLGLILNRVKSPSYLLLNWYFWAGTFSIGLFSIPASADSYRMLIVLPAAFVIAAIGIDKLLEVAGFQWETLPRSYAVAAVVILAGTSFLNVRIYYSDFAGKCRYGGNLEGRFASYLGSYVRTVDENSDVYLLSDAIYFYGSHGSTDFLSGRRKIVNYSEPMDAYRVQYGETLIASPNRIDELLAWASIHRGGQLTTIRDCQNVILVAYKLPEKLFEP